MAEVIRIAESASEPGPQALPQNVEAEASLLGALMIDNRLVEDVQLKLRPDHFFEPLHGRIYEAILRMTDSNRVANPVTLRPLFEGDESIKEVGGPAYLAQLTGSGAAIIGARDFAEQVYELALLRALIGVGREMVEKALDTGGGLSGITTGIDGINSKTGGLHHSDLIILAGRPGMGKTALATNIAF